MASREHLIDAAVKFLTDPSVVNSPIENKTAFMESKGMTGEEVEISLHRAGMSSSSGYASSPPQQQIVRQTQGGHAGYTQPQWPMQPPELPKRDWRDWFIMATVMGGVGYGAYVLAKRYVVPLIAPPTPPQLEQDKASIDASFEKVFALVEQLATDTQTLKDSEQERTERLDSALSEVETVIADLKTASRRREEESSRINDEIRGLKDLVPKAMEGQKENLDARLKELNEELKSLKRLMGTRMTPAASLPTPTPSTSTNPFSTPAGPISSSTGSNTTVATPYSAVDATTLPKPATVTTPNGIESSASIAHRTSSPYVPGRAAIPAWQRAAAQVTPAPAPGIDTSSAVVDGSSGASASG